MISFNWETHIACNYRCPYCFFDGRWEELAKGNTYPPLEETVRFWSEVHDRYGPCHIALGGGEQTVYPNFEKLLIQLTQWHHVHFTTNLHWPAQKWKSILEKIDPAKLSLSASFHPSEAELDPFLEKLRVLKSMGLNMMVQIVAYPPHLERLERDCGEIHRCGVNFYVQPFAGQYEGRSYPRGYSDGQRDLIHKLNHPQDSGPRPVAQNQLAIDRKGGLSYSLGELSPKGKLCTSGYEHCFIHQSGDVRRCTVVSEEKLGSMKEGFTLFSEPRPCPADLCIAENHLLVEEKERKREELRSRRLLHAGQEPRPR